MQVGWRTGRAALGVTTCVVAWTTVTSFGCGSETSSPATSVDGGPDARPATPSVDAASTVAIPDPPEGSVPAGWVLHRDYDPTCGFYVPSGPEFMPAPNRWAPCADIVGPFGVSGPEGIDCRRVVPDWQPRNDVDTTFIAGAGRAV